MSGALPADEIISWAKGQQAWRQDALRRILTRPFTKADEDECFELLKAEHGFFSSKVAEPLDAKHLPVRSASATTLRLLSIDQISNVNRLAEDAALTFAAEGITLIYGDNGSGKSGFIRILKKACRARDDEKILPDVFAKKVINAPAEARFSVQEGATTQAPITWRNDGALSSDTRRLPSSPRPKASTSLTLAECYSSLRTPLASISTKTYWHVRTVIIPRRSSQ